MDNKSECSKNTEHDHQNIIANIRNNANFLILSLIHSSPTINIFKNSFFLQLLPFNKCTRHTEGVFIRNYTRYLLRTLKILYIYPLKMNALVNSLIFWLTVENKNTRNGNYIYKQKKKIYNNFEKSILLKAN